MERSAWGMYPTVDCEMQSFSSNESLRHFVQNHQGMIPKGNFRSYGDSALGDYIVDMKPRQYFLDFDEGQGVLHVQSGVLLGDIISYFVPRGWFLHVSPGTKLITVGGAIASDVHGKNHHKFGCFSESVVQFNMMLANGEVISCSKENNADFFMATCGGQGLTGVILDAKIRLTRISSRFIQQVTYKTKNLLETFETFNRCSDATYSVAWVDCLSRGESLGRSLVMTGEFSDDGDFDYQAKKKIKVPIYFPEYCLNKHTVSAFNFFHYHKVRGGVSKKKVDIDTFFYPLDALSDWNRMYGRKGFLQYQFVLPLESSFSGLEKIINIISGSGKGSFLAVLKLFGKANDNFLSFPMEGYSLALDFQIEEGVFELLESLDNIVAELGGRIYLTKDCRVSKDVFELGYPNVEKFRKFRKQHNMESRFSSVQSKRIGI